MASPAQAEETDQLEGSPAVEPTTAAEEPPAQPAPETPAKRGRGRPKGSKNKKTLLAQATAVATGATSDAATSSEVPQKRKRGRPRKNPEPTGEPVPKRPRGRPPKNPKPPVSDAPPPPAQEAEPNSAAEAEEGGEDSEPAAGPSTEGEAPKKKRGRPRKNT